MVSPKQHRNGVKECMPVIPELRQQRQDDQRFYAIPGCLHSEFKVILTYMKSYLKVKRMCFLSLLLEGLLLWSLL